MSRAMPVSSGVVYHEKMGEVKAISFDLARKSVVLKILVGRGEGVGEGEIAGGETLLEPSGALC